MDDVASTNFSIYQDTPDWHDFPDDAPLAECSPRDKPWDKHRALAAQVQAIYAQLKEFEKCAVRISQCRGNWQ